MNLFKYTRPVNLSLKERVRSIGSSALQKVLFTGYCVVLLSKTIFYLKNIFSRRHEVIKQMYFTAVKTLPVLTIVGVFTGMILAIQTGLEMKNFGQEKFVGRLIVATLTREMGPFIAAIIVIASVGAAIAAEIGTMKVSEEIDALEVMSISPVKFLVMPRVVAMSLMMPVAAVYVTVAGAVGGAVVAVNIIGVSLDVYYQQALLALNFKAVYVGLLKASVFGMLASILSCANGLKAENGAIGVGKATRDSVVNAFIMVLIVGYFITGLFFRGRI